MKEAKTHYLFVVIIATLCLVAIPLQALAFDWPKIGATAKPTPKEKLVLMPLQVSAENKNMLGAMETALVQGLQQKYEVFSGEKVTLKVNEVFHKESLKKDCDETRCMVDIALAFNTDLVATANVTKIPGGYLLALSIKDVVSDKAVYSNSVPCKNCDAFQVVDKLKELSGASAAQPATSVQAATPAAHQRSQFAKETQQLANCVFPNSSDPAPGWVCNAPIEGYEITTIGSASKASKNPENKLPLFQHALLDAIVQISQQMNVTRQNVTMHNTKTIGAVNSEAVDVTTTVTKKFTNNKIGSNITVTSMTKPYIETTGEGKNKTEDKVNTSVSKLIMAHPCAYTMQSYVESTQKGESQTKDEVSEEVGKQCTIKDVLKELSRAGLDVVNTVKSPQGDIFLLLGSKNISAIKIY